MLKILKSFVLLFCIAISPQLRANTMENIKVVVPYAAGSGADNVFRTLQAYGLKRNINFVPEFKPGANGLIGAEYAASQAKDGRTLMLTVTSDLTNKAPVKKVDYTDFIPISILCSTHMYLVASKKFPANNLTQLVDILKRDSQAAAIASTTYRQNVVIKETFSNLGVQAEDLRLINFPAMQGISAIAGGHVDVGIWPATLIKPSIDSGNVKVMAALVQNEEIDSGKNFEYMYPADRAGTDGFGIFLPKGASLQMVKFWQDFIDDFKQDKEVNEMFIARYFHMFKKKGSAEINDIIKQQIMSVDKFSLTFRQQQIAKLIIDRGLSNEQIADTLNISESTVKLHAGIVYKKYGVRNRNQLVAMRDFG
jgi:tripartite-type tricarboxylate transporter receptor subunit TctC